MDSLPSGSIPSLLIMAAAALNPVIALLVGFVGTNQWLRWPLGEKRDHIPLERPEGDEVRR